MATIGAVCKMQKNQLGLTLIDLNVYYDPVRIVKSQTSYIEIGDDPGFIEVCYSDSGAESESDALEAPVDSDPANEIDDFLEGSIDNWKNDYYQPSFAIHIAIPSRRKICVIQPDEYGVHRDE
ncbi:hypothetical protein F2Q68_00016190 [Brassica cretica]|uniref:Uncharacterized protein n=1 Tax=Brassica cretica TaxID=69181 RepID=A0A8S9HCG3_BRACR|nr:hypothetical protein F2Q68_00016190 [Brassica cretica]